jgi:hypothetical protein
MNNTPTLSQRADALACRMSQELDYVVIKPRLYSMAEGHMGPAPNAAALNPASGDSVRLARVAPSATLLSLPQASHERTRTQR